MKRAILSTLFLTLLGGCVPQVVAPGHVGVWVTLGAADEQPLNEGLYWPNIVTTNLITMDVRVQKRTAEASASSRDLQVVSTQIALNYHIDGAHAVELYRSVGEADALVVRIIDPVLQEAVKTATAQFTAEELITRRPEVKDAIQAYVSKSLGASHVKVTDLSIINFSFDTEYQGAIEAKQVAEQQVLTAENDLRRIEVEARQAQAAAEGRAQSVIIEAKAEAERQELLAAQITPELVRWEQVRRWDGKTPLVQGEGAAALIDLAAVSKR